MCKDSYSSFLIVKKRETRESSHIYKEGASRVSESYISGNI